ncbi:MAG: membrane protein insertion efficiency factor YidD [Candidatus Cloacimonetes bacterium]|nr:membrane protein insertion efficiency factor YidD [Candidatus Cloacimonadota bacterium]
MFSTSQTRYGIRHILRLPNQLFLAFIRLYQIAISPFLPNSCRFEPSCSRYGYEAYRKYNFIKATYLTIWRIIRCNPFCKGGYDPLP